MGLGFVTQNVQANTLVQTMAPDELRGRVTSVYSLMFFGTAPFGSLLAGGVAQAIGSSLAIALGAHGFADVLAGADRLRAAGAAKLE